MRKADEMAMRPVIERLTLTGGVGVNSVKAEADIRYVVNNQEAMLTVQFVMRTDDDPTLSTLQKRVFEAVRESQPGKMPDA